MTAYFGDLLKNPHPNAIIRKKIVPLSRFNDDDIMAFDYATWKSAGIVYQRPYEAHIHQIDELAHDIECYGLHTKIEIMQRGDSLYVADGHHRVYVLKNVLSWTHIPYRWYIPGLARGRRVGFQRQPLPPPRKA